MEGVQFRSRLRGNPGGYVLLIGLLIVVMLGMVLFYVRMHGPVYEIGKGKSDITPPWRQWHKIQVRLRDGPLGSPTEEQPQLSKPLEIRARPVQDGNQRGDIGLMILADGTVEGRWGGQFYINKKVDFQVMNCRFKGTVDPEEVYEDEEGEDPSKLFFIAKGGFVILETNSDTGRVRNVVGDAYARGWLGLDDEVSGEVIITTDERKFYVYTWEGQGGEVEGMRDLGGLFNL